MNRAFLVALLLIGCAEAHTIAEEWQPLQCDAVERVTWEVTETAGDVLRITRNTRLTTVAEIDAGPASVIVRTAAGGESCSIEDGCTVSPDGLYRYFSAGPDIVTGPAGGPSRVTCSETLRSTITTHEPGEDPVEGVTAIYTQVWIEGGDYTLSWGPP